MCNFIHVAAAHRGRSTVTAGGSPGTASGFARTTTMSVIMSAIVRAPDIRVVNILKRKVTLSNNRRLFEDPPILQRSRALSEEMAGKRGHSTTGFIRLNVKRVRAQL